MFGKAITLRNLGRIDEAMSLADAILLLYDNANVRKFKKSLKAAGTLDSSSPITLDQAIEELTGMAYDILHKNDLLGPDGSVVTERAICQKEVFAAQVYRFCKKRYTSSGKEKLNSESILKAFYGSLCTTLFYYNDPDCLAGHNAYNYLIEHVDIERVDDVAEKMLNIRGDKTSCDNLWNLIYGYVILSNHMKNLTAYEQGTNWGLCIANRDSHFKVLGTHHCNGRTAIILLHLLDDERWKLFEKAHLSLEEDIRNKAIYSFETKIQLPPIPELTTNDWLKRCEFPLGVDNNREPWPL